MCITFPVFSGSHVSCDNTQFFLAQDSNSVRLLGLLPVKASGDSAPSLLFFPLPSEFADKIQPVSEVKCQADVIDRLMNLPPVATRGLGLSFGSAMPGARVVKNQDGSVVCVLKSSSIQSADIVGELEALLATNGINPRIVIHNKELFMEQLGTHFQPGMDMIVCVPKFENSVPVVDGSGFSIQFVWPTSSFDGRIPLPGLVHNHAHDGSKVEENYHIVSYLPFTKMIFDGGIEVEIKRPNFPNISALPTMHQDLCKASGTSLANGSVFISNLKNTQVGGRTCCLLYMQSTPMETTEYIPCSWSPLKDSSDFSIIPAPGQVKLDSFNKDLLLKYGRKN